MEPPFNVFLMSFFLFLLTAGRAFPVHTLFRFDIKTRDRSCRPTTSMPVCQMRKERVEKYGVHSQSLLNLSQLLFAVAEKKDIDKDPALWCALGLVCFARKVNNGFAPNNARARTDGTKPHNDALVFGLAPFRISEPFCCILRRTLYSVYTSYSKRSFNQYHKTCRVSSLSSFFLVSGSWRVFNIRSTGISCPLFFSFLSSFGQARFHFLSFGLFHGYVHIRV